MIKSFKLFEELKREVPMDYDISDTFNPFDPAKVKFKEYEIEPLAEEDFIVDGNIATCVENQITYQIEKSAPDEFSIIYELKIKDNKGNVLKSRKFKTNLMANNVDYCLDVILNICAAYNRDNYKHIHQDIDPYGEETWK